ncbi:hypothetical protein [Gordonibacter massiliensis (ex Traore et al. 2017)]|uniref:Ferric oxidoreductase domain-containing protein n=1 Tax=Gordonibacter massiliensis (ex Traore et al. 2017) TaxID=1841863 RepID=A0A842JF23_9ACTN|nr:hypothetical protein [Gordonibacter massiliensis (ex Traore et al. 2017)]MBC2887939.1 hypothetical protein [Gordonibacter massiliensis (ex Traore et al. 2017)]
MEFLIVLAATILACFALRNPVKRWPVLFYVLAVALVMLFICGAYVPLPRPLWSLLLVLVQKCMLSLALFVVVMYLGVFARESKVGTWLRPIRAELSIVAWILSLGHMTMYLVSYAPRLLAGRIDGNVLAALVLALVLFALLLVLGVTSFNVVKKRMKTGTWKRVQLLAYPFFGLVYVHLLLMLLPSALRGGEAAQTSIVVYSVVFGAYAVLRVVRAVRDCRAGLKNEAQVPA